MDAWVDHQQALPWGRADNGHPSFKPSSKSVAYQHVCRRKTPSVTNQGALADVFGHKALPCDCPLPTGATMHTKRFEPRVKYELGSHMHSCDSPNPELRRM